MSTRTHDFKTAYDFLKYPGGGVVSYITSTYCHVRRQSCVYSDGDKSSGSDLSA